MAGALLKYNGQALQTPSGAYGINNLVPENVKSGVNIGGVVGTYSGDINIAYKRFVLTSAAYSITITDVNFSPSQITLARQSDNEIFSIIMINSELPRSTWGYYLYRDISGTRKYSSSTGLTFTYNAIDKTLQISVNDTNQTIFKNGTYEIFIK